MILQEYLVKLGWNVDEPSLKKFVGAVSATGARTAELGSAAIETAAAIELMVSRVARSYETLYYVSQRTKQSVGFIQATGFAFKQIGLSADEATASIEGIAATFRTQPWLRGLFGGANTPQQIATNLGRSGLPYFLQVKFAEMVGLSEKTLFQMQRFAEVEASAQESFSFRQKAAGLDPDDLARKSANFGRELNKLESDLEIFGDRMAADLIGPTQQGIQLFDQAVQWINRVDNATKGWTGTIIALAGTAGGLLVFEKVVRRVLGLGGTTTVGKGLGFFGKLGRGGLIGGLLGVLGLVKSDNPETKASLRQALGPLLYELGLSKSPDLTEGGLAGDANFPNPAGGNASGNRFRPNAGRVPAGAARERLSQAVEFFKKNGFSAEAAQGIAASLFYESDRTLSPTAFNPAGGGRGAIGIGQWRGGRQDQFEKLFGHKIGEGSFEEQLQYVLWELTQGGERATGSALGRKGLSPREAAGTFISGFERPGAAGIPEIGAAGNLAESLSGLVAPPTAPSKSVTLNAKTDVHVNGGPGTFSTMRQYTDAQNSVNDTLIRNLTGRVQ
jgi:hypothetical protein